MSEPVMSDGSRSGVNWIRESWASRFLARLLMARVLARPGRPSTRRCPLASRPRIKRSIIPSWPMIDSDIRAFSWRTSSLMLIATRSGESSCCACPLSIKPLRCRRAHSPLLRARLRGVLLDLGFDIASHLIDRETRLLLARWVFDEGLQKGRGAYADIKNQIAVLRQPIVVLVGDDVGSLVGVHAQVEN